MTLGEAQWKMVILLEDWMKLWLANRNRSKTLREEEKETEDGDGLDYMQAIDSNIQRRQSVRYAL